MRIRSKNWSWSFFIGYDPEEDWYRIYLKWGGRFPYRNLSGKLVYRNQVGVHIDYPLRYLRIGYYRKPRFGYTWKLMPRVEYEQLLEKHREAEKGFVSN